MISAPPTPPPSTPSSPTSTSLSHSPSWPDPAAILLSSTFKPKVLSPRSRPRSLRSGKLTRFELSLVDHLADFLEGGGGQTIKSIVEATRVQAQLTGGAGEKKFVCWGSASAVAKARQLVDARLSQTPIHIFLAIRLSSEASSLKFKPSTTATQGPPPPNPGPSYQLVEVPPSHSSPGSLLRQALLNLESTPVSTPDSDKSDQSFFCEGLTSDSRTPSRGSLLGDNRAFSLPAIGSLIPQQAAYFNAIVEEIDSCVARSSLVKLKLMAGTQLFQPSMGDNFTQGGKVSLEELSRFKIDGTYESLHPHFCVALSEHKAEQLHHRLATKMGLQPSRVSSQVHILYLDRRRAVYASATSDLKGGEMRNHQPGSTASGTLLLRKCSTLPSKPFFLSVTTPALESEDLSEGNDLRIKVLADKAATSPSSELSAAIQRASWDLDVSGQLEVHVELDPARFTASETEIKWRTRTRYENDEFRASVTEYRLHGTKHRWHEVEFTSKLLHARLESIVESRRVINRVEVSAIVGRFIEWSASVVKDIGTEVLPEKIVSRSSEVDLIKSAEEDMSDTSSEGVGRRV